VTYSLPIDRPTAFVTKVLVDVQLKVAMKSADDANGTTILGRCHPNQRTRTALHTHTCTPNNVTCKVSPKGINLTFHGLSRCTSGDWQQMQVSGCTLVRTTDTRPYIPRILHYPKFRIFLLKTPIALATHGTARVLSIRRVTVLPYSIPN
jgi:hypothetical protein